MCIITTTVASTAAMVAMALVTTAAAATSTAISLSQVSANKKLAAYQIEQNKKEAKKYEMQAAYERQEGVESARNQKLNAILSMADKKAKLAGNNVAMSSGLVLNLENDAKINSELDALTTQRDAERKAQNYLDKRDSLYQNAALISFNSKLNRRTAYAQLGTSTLGSIGSKSM